MWLRDHAITVLGILFVVLGLRIVVRRMPQRGVRESLVIGGVLLLAADLVPLIHRLLTGRSPIGSADLGLGMACRTLVGAVAIYWGIRGAPRGRAS